MAENTDEDLLFSDWVSLHATKLEPTFLFWIEVLELETLLLTFVRSLRTGEFQLFKDCIRKMLPYYFAKDRQNYARWLTVELCCLEELEHTALDVYQQFKAGKNVQIGVCCPGTTKF